MQAKLLVLALTLLIATPQLVRAQAIMRSNKELLPNPYFASDARGWILRDAVPITLDKAAKYDAVQLNGVRPGPDSWSHVGVILTPIPINQRLNFSCLLLGKTAGQRLNVNAFAYDSNKNLLQYWSGESAVDAHGWKKFDACYVVPHDTTSLAIWVVDKTGQTAYVSRASLIAGRAQTGSTLVSAMYGPSSVKHSSPKSSESVRVILAKVKAYVRPIDGSELPTTVTFPIPGLYREQIPLSFEVKTEPSNALMKYKIHRRDDGLNWLCDVTFRPNADGNAIFWNSVVLVNGRKQQILPKAKFEAAPTEVAQWTRSTACVQSSDLAIRAKADQLASGTSDVESYARRVIEFTSTNRGKAGEVFNALDAKKALECGGSCTSRANLAAALLRARGVPARTLSHLPTWCDSLFEHWLVEYWHPGVGWVWAESTLNKFQPSPNTLTVLAVSSAEDEDNAGDPIHLRYIMPGAAYLSALELSKDLMSGGVYNKAEGVDANSLNVAIDQGEIHGSAGEILNLFETARKQFERLSAQTGTTHAMSADVVLSAVRTGRAADLSATLKREN
jgi:hypothetical protein